MKVTDAVVLAGGSGTRIRGTLGDLPKALAEVKGKPLLERKLDELRSNQISRAYILTGIGHLQVSAFLNSYRKSHSSIRILEYSDGFQALGTGGALCRALPQLPAQFFLTYGDSLLGFDYQLLEVAAQQTGLPHAIATTTNPGPSDRFNCCVKDQRLIRYDKTGGEGMNSTDYGVLLCSRDDLAIEMESEVAPFDLSSTLSRLASRRQVSAVLTSERYLEIGTPQGLAHVRQHFNSVGE